VQFTVLEHSSGDQGLDDLALAHVQQVAFAPAQSPMIWGFATFSWGGEAYAAPSRTP
jgi:hypothetical protein